MSRLDFSGLRDELILENLPTNAHPEGKTYFVRDPSTEDVQRLLEIREQADEATRKMFEATIPAGDDETDEQAGARITAAETDVKAANAAMTEFLTVDGVEVTLLRRLLGSSLDQIEADGIGQTNYDQLQEAVLDAVFGGLDTAQRELSRRVLGEAEARGNRATRRAEAKKSTGSSRKAGSSTTRKRAPRKRAASSSATRARTTGQASTPASKTSAASTAKAAARKAG